MHLSVLQPLCGGACRRYKLSLIGFMFELCRVVPSRAGVLILFEFALVSSLRMDFAPLFCKFGSLCALNFVDYGAALSNQ